MKPRDLQVILDAHELYWGNKRDALVRYKAVYEMDFWDTEKDAGLSQIRIQTSDGYGYIESFQASLFAKNPAVAVKNGVLGKGDAKKSQSIINHFLLNSRNEIENASRMALIYPMSFLKLTVTDRENLYERVLPVAVPPWQVIVDRDATRWDTQRFVGHVYYMTVAEAKDKFGGKFDDIGGELVSFFEEGIKDATGGARPKDPQESPISPMFQYVKIVELYDLVEDKLYWWCPGRGDKWLDKADFIPFRDAENRGHPPIVPLYYNRIPDQPMLGYSAIKRIYDQLYEMNIIRSFQANAVRKASRQWLVKKGAMTDDEMSQITSGIDGLFVEVESDDPLGSLIVPVPHQNLPSEVSRYMQDVIRDKDSGSVTAAFTRGEATKATATEIAALAAYTTSEIGRMARERDGAIEMMGRVYLLMVALFIEEAKVPTLVLLDGEAQTVKPDDLTGDFQIFAADQASTPISEAIREQRLLQNAQLLQALGVPNHKILEEVVRTMGLPEDFLEAAPVPQQPGAGIPGVANPEEPITGLEAVNNPTPGNVTDMLLGGGVGFNQ
tara:strand:- start:2048 stop:3709 length:1662 start_codon:yes stop_codon:yes gene_type:complete